MSSPRRGTATEPASRRLQAAVLLVSMAISAALGALAARSYLTWHNTLANNGNWISTKTTLERGLIGAYSFINGRQTLAGGALHLDAWHGHNEVTHVRELGGLESIELDVKLAGGAYLVVFFNRLPGEDYDAVRLSARDHMHSGVLRVSPEGEFLDFTSMRSRPVARDVWHRLRIDFAPPASRPAPAAARAAPLSSRAELPQGAESRDLDLEVSLNGESLGRFPHLARPAQRFGFRSGFAAAPADDVFVTEAGGHRLVETFDLPSGSSWILATAVAVLLLANLAILWVLRRATGTEGLTLSFYFLMVNGTLLLLGAIVFVFVLMRSDRYLFSADRLAEEEAYFRKGASDRVIEEARARHALQAEPGVHRILFLGGSQTWGAGAQRDEDVFVRVVETMLNEADADRRRYECVNGGVSATKLVHQLRQLQEVWSGFQPELVVFNVSSNDKGTSRFADILDRAVSWTLESGARVLLVKEANSTEKHTGGLGARHREMDAVAARYGVPVVDMHGYLESRKRDGFLWWDFVHLTSYGQRLAAEKLSEEILALVPPEDAMDRRSDGAAR